MCCIKQNSLVEREFFAFHQEKPQPKMEHAEAQNLYNAAVSHGMVHLGTFPFGRVNNIWVVGYPDTELARYLQKNMNFKR
jgi:hypothetical protein